MLKLVLILIAASAFWGASAAECMCDGQPVAEQASSRIPPKTVRGRTNTRFEWMPGPMDLVFYYANKWKIREWMRTKFYPAATQYLPRALRFAIEFQQDKNYVIAAIPAILKYMKTW